MSIGPIGNTPNIPQYGDSDTTPILIPGSQETIRALNTTMNLIKKGIDQISGLPGPEFEKQVVEWKAEVKKIEALITELQTGETGTVAMVPNWMLDSQPSSSL